MDPRKLSPAVLLALGLHGCQCEEQHVGPCLSFVPADPPDDPPDPPIGPCLDTLPPEPPVGPCLTPLPPDLPEPPIGPCLEPPLEPPEPRNHPCLSIAPPHIPETRQDAPETPVRPCLSEPYHESPAKPEPPGKKTAADQREAVLRRVESALPPDVAATLRRMG